MRWPPRMGIAESAVTLIDEMKAEPWRFDFYHVLRQLERANPDRPRIGDSAARREEYVDLGQDPYLEFPGLQSCRGRRPERPAARSSSSFSACWAAGRVAACHDRRKSRLAVDARRRLSALSRPFNDRFLQLFFRAWSDARPIAQHDRPRRTASSPMSAP